MPKSEDMCQTMLHTFSRVSINIILLNVEQKAMGNKCNPTICFNHFVQPAIKPVTLPLSFMFYHRKARTRIVLFHIRKENEEN